METPRYTVHRRALLSESTLTPAEREALETAIAPLVKLPEKDWPSTGAIRLGLPEPTFFIKLGPSLRVFVRPTPGGKPEVLDFVHQELLDRYFKPLRSTKKSLATRGVDKRS
jgi:hypothetical protein